MGNPELIFVKTVRLTRVSRSQYWSLVGYRYRRTGALRADLRLIPKLMALARHRVFAGSIDSLYLAMAPKGGVERMCRMYAEIRCRTEESAVQGNSAE